MAEGPVSICSAVVAGVGDPGYNEEDNFRCSAPVFPQKLAVRTVLGYLWICMALLRSRLAFRRRPQD